MGLRVARIITRLNRGGPARTILAIEPLLQRKGVDSLLLCGDAEPGEDDLLPEARKLGLNVVHVAALSRSAKPLRDLMARHILGRLLRQFEPDIIHTHTFKAGLLGRSAAVAGNTRRVHTFHGHLFRGYFSAVTSRALVGLERRLARRTDRLVAVSEAVRRDLAERYRIAPAEQIEVIPGIIPPEERPRWTPRRAELRAAMGVPVGGPWIGTIARLAAIKAPQRFLECARQVLEQVPDAQFFWIGDGPQRQRFLAEIARLGLSRAVHWFGWQRSTGPWHQRLDVELLLSDQEGLPLSLLEARSFQIPVVATAVGGVVDLVRDEVDGLLVATDHGGSAAAAVLRCLRNPAEARGRAERASVQDHGRYTPQNHVERLWQLYQSLSQADGAAAREMTS